MEPLVLHPDLGANGVQVAPGRPVEAGVRTGWGDQGAAEGGQPRRASSRRAGAPFRLPVPQELQREEEESEEEEEQEDERECAPQPEPLPSGLPPTSGR